MKRAFFVFSMLSLSGATTLAQNIYVHVEQEGKRLEQLGTAEFEVNADSHPCVEFVNGKAVMTINGKDEYRRNDRSRLARYLIRQILRLGRD